MKKRSGCFSRLLGILIVLGIIGAAGLCYLGYDKANDAETMTTPVKDLRPVYIGEAAVIIETESMDSILTDLIGDNEIMKTVTAALGDNALEEMIVKTYYLPDDESISTSIGQIILTHRLSKTYSEEELLYIYCGMMGYEPSIFDDIKGINTQSEIPVLRDILNYLTEQNIISEDTAAEIENILP